MAAVKRALVLIESGKLWFAHLDIKEFYPSFKIEKLLGNAALEGILPKSTVANLVLARGLEYVIDPGYLKRYPLLSCASRLLEARRGIPTGSCVSSLVAPMMVSRLQLSAAVAATLINYEDDFLLLASSKEGKRPV